MRFGIGSSNNAKTSPVTSFLVPGFAHQCSAAVVVLGFCKEIRQKDIDVTTHWLDWIFNSQRRSTIPSFINARCG